MLVSRSVYFSVTYWGGQPTALLPICNRDCTRHIIGFPNPAVVNLSIEQLKKNLVVEEI